MQFELTKEFLDHFQTAVDEKNDDFIREMVEELYAADISSILYQLNTDDSKYVIELLDSSVAAEIISDLDEEVQSKFLKNFSPEQVSEFIDYVDSDDAADILDDLPLQFREEVISKVSNPEKAENIVDLLKYDEDCAGGLMAKEFIKANINWTVIQCIEEIRRQAENVQKVHTIYVVDDRDRLLGRVSLKKLILAADQTKIEDIYSDDLIAVETFKGEEEVAELMRKYDLETIPVVNVQGKLLGRITIDDVVDVITELAEREKQLMAGLSENVEHRDSVWLLTRARLPWLVIGVFGGMFAAKVIGLFEDELAILPQLVFFIPLIMATGGNVGIQSSSIVVQGLASKTLSQGSTWNRVGKSIVVAVINGAVISGIVYGLNFFFLEDDKVGLVVAIALFCVVILSSLMGTITPLVLDKLNVNPALASGPFITTANDLIGIGIYFLVASLLY